MKLRMTIVQEWEVADLAAYEATTIEEAAQNQQKWFDEGDFDPLELLDNFTVTVEAVK